MDQWNELKQYELQQRQQRIAKSQQLVEEQSRKKKEADIQQLLREQERIAATQRQEEERRIAKQQATEQRRREEDSRIALLQQVAKDQTIANRRRYEAQQEAHKRMEEQQAIKEKGSPIERLFHEAWCQAYPDVTLIRQHSIGKYRVDFAHEASMTVIELDGHDFHSRKKDRNRDYRRQQEIEDLGWRFIRFTGTQVFLDVEGCVDVVWRRIQIR